MKKQKEVTQTEQFLLECLKEMHPYTSKDSYDDWIKQCTKTVLEEIRDHKRVRNNGMSDENNS